MKRNKLTLMLLVASIFIILLFAVSCAESENGKITTEAADTTLPHIHTGADTTAQAPTPAVTTNDPTAYREPEPKNRYILFPKDGVERVSIEYKEHSEAAIAAVLSEKYEDFRDDADFVAPILYTRADKSEYEIYFAYVFGKTYLYGGYTAYVKDGYIVALWESEPESPMVVSPDITVEGAFAQGYKGDIKEALSLMLLRVADILSENNQHLAEFEGGVQTTEDKNGYRYYYYGIWAYERQNEDTLHCIEYAYYKEKIS